MTSETVYSRFSIAALSHGDGAFLNVLPETAAIYGIETGEISYTTMAQRVALWQDKLRDAGFGAGVRVGLLLHNRPVFLEIWFALNGLGASVVPLNPDLRLSELEYVIGHSEMDAAFVVAERHEEVTKAARNVGNVMSVFVPGESITPLASPSKDQNSSDSTAEAALLYTSGTTGQPKGCVLTNEYFLHCGDWYRDVGGLVQLRPGQERMLTPLPVFHMNAMAVSVMAMVTVGGCLTMLDRFHPKSWWDSVQQSGATCLHYLGVMPSMLMKAALLPSDKAHAVQFGFGAGVTAELHDPFEARFGFPLIEAWAMTETGSGGTICANREPRKTGTSCFGRPSVDVQIRIVGDEGGDVADPAPGELLVRRNGPDPRYGFFREYLKNAEATNEAWQDGWFHTGDIVSRDEDGDLHFVDRKKNVIRRSGENISAVEVEAVLAKHPLVQQVGVAATPDAIRGDEVAALIVLNGGAPDQDTASAIVRWCLERMAYYKAPGWIGFVDTLPVTPTQKILRAALKNEVAEKMGQSQLYDLCSLKKRQV